MPCFIHERIVIRLAADGAAPAAFTWQGRRYVVSSVTACWKAVGPWWDEDGERTYFRVIAGATAEGKGESGLYELCYDHEGGRWFLETVVD
jgi:hypothetical protein